MPRRAATESKRSSRSLAAILGRGTGPVRDPAAFMEALRDWVLETPGRRGLPFGELPDHARAITLLVILYLEIESEGMSGFLEHSTGAFHAEIVDCCRTIGASETAAYLEGAARLFDGGVVPTDDDERESQVMAHLERADTEKTPDPFWALDKQYAKAARAELPIRLRAWLRAHRREAEAERGSAAKGDPDEIVFSRFESVPFAVDLLRQLLEKEAEGIEVYGFPTGLVRLGDLVEIPTDDGGFVYVHVVATHALQRIKGFLVRAFAGVHPSRPADLAGIVAGREQFLALCKVDNGIAEGEATVVGNFAVPNPDAPFPTCRYRVGNTRGGRTAWGLWDGGTTRTGIVLSPLPAELRLLPLLESNDVDDIAERVARGWTPADDVGTPA